MTNLSNLRRKPLATRQHGFNLIEVMISLLVLALGMAGIAALLIQGMTTTNAATLNSLAVAQAQTGVEMMRSNLEAYTVGWYDGTNTSGNATSVTCTNACDSAQQAGNDFYTWRTQVAANMPDGQAFICTDSTPDDGQPGALDCDNLGTNVVKVFWRDVRDPDFQDGADESEFQRFVTSVSP